MLETSSRDEEQTHSSPGTEMNLTTDAFTAVGGAPEGRRGGTEHLRGQSPEPSNREQQVQTPHPRKERRPLPVSRRTARNPPSPDTGSSAPPARGAVGSSPGSSPRGTPAWDPGGQETRDRGRRPQCSGNASCKGPLPTCPRED